MRLVTLGVAARLLFNLLRKPHDDGRVALAHGRAGRRGHHAGEPPLPVVVPRRRASVLRARLHRGVAAVVDRRGLLRGGHGAHPRAAAGSPVLPVWSAATNGGVGPRVPGVLQRAVPGPRHPRRARRRSMSSHSAGRNVTAASRQLTSPTTAMVPEAADRPVVGADEGEVPEHRREAAEHHRAARRAQGREDVLAAVGAVALHHVDRVVDADPERDGERREVEKVDAHVGRSRGTPPRRRRPRAARRAP